MTAHHADAPALHVTACVFVAGLFAAALSPVRGDTFWTPTWLPRPRFAPGWAAAAYVGVPIDFALVAHPRKASLSAGPDLGGDHLPVILRLAAPPR